MKNEQSLLLAVRHQLSALGYTESEIDAQDSAIEHFAKLIVKSIDIEKTKMRSLNIGVKNLAKKA